MHDFESIDDEVDLFNSALELPSGEREAFVRTRVGSESIVVRRIMRLLEAHDEAERAEFDVSAASEVKKDPCGPSIEWIGPYRVLERLGEGGMGVVYSAAQTKPLRRRVAIKIVKLGMDTAEVLARFEAERQAMAIMDHPCVAKALDAGVTDEGRPYFVMELVKGVTLGDYLAKHSVDLEARIRLFLEIGSAVRHAHQKGIIHRDLKPSNILVEVRDGRPSPKVIDFGVAKATAIRLTERTLYTEQGRVIGTPEYMSPEQAETNGLDVDTRADVYSLGVILYELLTGVLPFDSREIRSAGYLEVLRTIREVDPPRPSTRILERSRASEEPTGGQETRAREVRGELDWIVMRAIAKDPASRYATVNALMEDLERYLADVPVLAGPPGVLYVARKYLERHRIVAASIGLAALVLVTGIAGLSIGLLRANQAWAVASERADNAQVTADFLRQVLFQADPESGAQKVTLLQVMENASQLVDEELAPYPEVEASVRDSLGVAYRRRSLFALAEPHLERALDLRLELFGGDDPRTAQSLIALANLRFENNGAIDATMELLRRAEAIYRDAGLADTEADGWLQLDIGQTTLTGDRLNAAESAFERSRALLADARGAEHPDVSRPLRGLAEVALARGDLEIAEGLAESAVQLCEGGDAMYIGARAQMVLARVRIALGRIEEASELLDRAAVRLSATVGAEHIRAAERCAILARLHLVAEEPETAAVAARECEERFLRLVDEDHWAILEARLLGARSSLAQRDSDAEEQLLALTDPIATQLGLDHALAVEVARARLDRAEAFGGPSAVENCTRAWESLVARRTERLARSAPESPAR